MSATSANPEDLGAFTDASKSATERIDGRISALQNKERAVAAACEQHYPTTPSIPAARELHDSWVTNADFVRTIRDELLEADQYNADGNPVIDSSRVQQALENAGLTDPPGIVTSDEIEMLGQRPHSGYVDDPICMANGNFILEEEDLPMYGLAEVLSLRRTYNSRDDLAGVFGTRWTSVIDSSLQIGERQITHRGGDGGGFVFRRLVEGGWSQDHRNRRVLLETDEGWAVDEARERTWFFDSEGVITGFVDGASRVRIDRNDAEIVVREEKSERWISHELDPATGLVTAAVSSDGRRVTYHHRDGHLTHVERDVGDMTYEIDDAGFLEAGTDADGITLFRNTYDTKGWVLSQIEHHGRETSYEYRSDGVSTVTSTDGAPPNVMVHDRRGRMTAMIDGLGHAMRITYDERDNITQMVDRAGSVTRYRHDDRGNVIERVDPDGLTHEFEWDDLDRLVSETDRAGSTVTYEYDGDHREPSRTVLPDGGVVTTRFDEAGLLASVTDADGVTAGVRRDQQGDVTAILDPTGETLMALGYDIAGRVVQANSGERVSSAVMDAGGRVLSLDGPDGQQVFEYSAAGRAVGASDPAGAFWRYERDDTGEIVSLGDEQGVLLHYERDGVGDVVATVDAEGGRTEYERDPLGRQIAMVDGEGNRTEYRYDAEGRIVGVIDALGGHFSREWDALGRVISETEPSGARRLASYHPNGELASETDAAGNTWRMEIDANGQTAAIIDPTGATSSLRHTSAGRFLELRSPTGRVVRNEYDDKGDLIRTIDPEGDEIERGSDSVDFQNGLPESVTIDGVTSRLTHDPRGLLREAIDPAGVITRFMNDGVGRLTDVVTGETAMSYTWDAAGRLTSITDPNGHVTRFRRGSIGEITRIEHADGTGLLIGRDVDGYLERITDLDETRSIDLERDVRGLITRVVEGERSVTASYDARRSLTALATETGTVGFERDPDGALTAVSDDAHRITIDRDEHASKVGFRLDDRATVPVPPELEVERDDNGRITVDEKGRRFEYDLAGRLASTTVGSRSVTYEYDDLGLLSTEHHPEGTRMHRHGASGEILWLREADGSETTYSYDLLGRRIAEHRGDGTRRSFHWDSLGRLTGFTDTDSDGGQRRRRIERDALSRPMRVDGVSILWADAVGIDLLGIGEERFARVDTRVRSLTDPGGEWSRHVGDDPWGFDGGDGVRLGHRGHLAVDDLVFMGARIYDPLSRSFLSRDPLPSIPGQVSYAGLYQYAWCDPVNLLDPTGRRPLSDEEYAKWEDENSKGWVRKNWKSITVTAVAVTVGAVVTVATAGTAGPLAVAAIGAVIGGGAGVVDAKWNGKPWGEALKQGAIGGVIGGLTGGLGAGLGNVARNGTSRAANFLANQNFVRNGLVQYPGAYAQEGLNYAWSGDPNVQFDPIAPLVYGTMSTGASTVADRISATRTPTDPEPTPAPEAPTTPDVTLDGLREVPGIGETLSSPVLDARNQAGGPLSYDQLLEINQIGPVRAQAIMDAGMN